MRLLKVYLVAPFLLLGMLVAAHAEDAKQPEQLHAPMPVGEAPCAGSKIIVDVPPPEVIFRQKPCPPPAPAAQPACQSCCCKKGLLSRLFHHDCCNETQAIQQQQQPVAPMTMQMPSFPAMSFQSSFTTIPTVAVQAAVVPASAMSIASVPQAAPSFFTNAVSAPVNVMQVPMQNLAAAPAVAQSNANNSLCLSVADLAAVIQSLDRLKVASASQAAAAASQPAATAASQTPAAVTAAEVEALSKLVDGLASRLKDVTQKVQLHDQLLKQHAEALSQIQGASKPVK